MFVKITMKNGTREHIDAFLYTCLYAYVAFELGYFFGVINIRIFSKFKII